MPENNERPRLRPLDIRPITYQGQALLLLRDPLGLAENTVLIPQEVAPILALCDGTRDRSTLAAAVALRLGWRIPQRLLDDLVETLDRAFLLENERYRQAFQAAVAAFREMPARVPSLAGSSYPENPVELRRLLRSLWKGVGPVPPARRARGLITPHIDYERGGEVYARVWRAAAPAARQADLVLLLGTDHHGGEGPITLTRQSYATPLGTLPTAGAVVDAIAERLGDEAVFSGELYHRDEHSIELAAVWLQYARREAPCEVVPVLCGSLERGPNGGDTDGVATAVNHFVEAISESTRGRRVFVVAAADLAHVGPAFGGRPLSHAGRKRLEAADQALLERVASGDAEGFLAAIRETGNANNVCGVSAIYLALRLLGTVSGECVSYAHCPADQAGTSAVSVCGVLLR